MDILTFKGEKPFRKNAGIVARPSEYELHWFAELKDGSTMTMFGDDTPESKRSFQEVQNKDVLYALWRGVKNPTFHLGVTFDRQFPKFMFGEQLLSPLHPLYYSGSNFYPDFFIRNIMPIQTAAGKQPIILDQEKEMIYFAGFKFTVKDQVHGMYLAFNGADIKSEGFDNFEICGGYRLDG